MKPEDFRELCRLARLDERKRSVGRWNRVSACQGKATFATFALANEVAQRHARDAGRRAAYHCRECGQYHVGTAKARVSRLLYRQRKEEAAA